MKTYRRFTEACTNPNIDVDRHIKIHLVIHLAIIGVPANQLHSRPQADTAGRAQPPSELSAHHPIRKQAAYIQSSALSINLADNKQTNLTFALLSIHPRSGRYVRSPPPQREGTTVPPPLPSKRQARPRTQRRTFLSRPSIRHLGYRTPVVRVVIREESATHFVVDACPSRFGRCGGSRI
jgi:hypothetical protein